MRGYIEQRINFWQDRQAETYESTAMKAAELVLIELDRALTELQLEEVLCSKQ